MPFDPSALPFTRGITAAAGSQIPSALANGLQDTIIANVGDTIISLGGTTSDDLNAVLPPIIETIQDNLTGVRTLKYEVTGRYVVTGTWALSPSILGALTESVAARECLVFIGPPPVSAEIVACRAKVKDVAGSLIQFTLVTLTDAVGSTTVNNISPVAASGGTGLIQTISQPMTAHTVQSALRYAANFVTGAVGASQRVVFDFEIDYQMAL